MATTTNFGWETPDDTDLVKDGAAAIRTALGGVDTSFVDLKGGTTGQVLAKASNTDLDFVWSADAAGMTNPMTTKGDTIYSSSGSTPARLAVGSTGQVLTVAGGVPTWATPAASTTSLTQIATGSLSGTSVTLSSLSSYNNLLLTVYSATWGTGSNELNVLINNDSSSLYRHEGNFVDSSSSAIADIGRVNVDYYKLGTTTDPLINTGGDNAFMINLNNCKSASGYTNWISNASGKITATRWKVSNIQGVYKNNATVSSLVIKTENNYSFTGGTYVLWGS